MPNCFRETGGTCGFGTIKLKTLGQGRVCVHQSGQVRAFLRGIGRLFAVGTLTELLTAHLCGAAAV